MSRSLRSRRALAVTATLALASSLAATGSALAADPSAAPTVAPMPSMGSMASPAAAVITVQDAWTRSVADTATPGAAYLTILNGTGVDDALIGVSSPAAGTVELHETSADASGMMAMHPVERVELAAGATVSFEPGGYHIMLIDLVAPLVEGATVPLTLTFEHAPAVTVEAQVRSETGQPMPSMAMPGMDAGPSASPAPSMAM